MRPGHRGRVFTHNPKGPDAMTAYDTLTWMMRHHMDPDLIVAYIKLAHAEGRL